jgi:hypothetical protein
VEGAPGLRAQYVLLIGISGVLATLPLVLALGAAPGEGCVWEKALYWVGLLLLCLVPMGTIFSLACQGCLTEEGLRTSPTASAIQAVLDPWQTVAFLLLIGGVVVGWLLADHSRLTEAARALFAERAANLFSGCSPVVPTVVVALGLAVYGLLGLQGVRLMTEFRVASPYPKQLCEPGVVNDAIRRVRETVRDIDYQFRSIGGAFTEPGQGSGAWWPRLVVWGTAGVFAVAVIAVAFTGRPVQWGAYWLGLAVVVGSVFFCGPVLLFVWDRAGKAGLSRPRWSALLLLLLVGVACAIALHRSQRTWESQAWNCLFATGLVALAFLTLVASYRFYLLWKQVEKLTRAIVTIPMVGAFDRFPDKVSRVFGAYLLSARSRAFDLAIPAHLLRQLHEALSQPFLHTPQSQAALAALPSITPTSSTDPDELHGQDANALCEVAAGLVSALAPGWEDRPVPEAFGTSPAEAEKEAPQGPEWRRLAEQFVAIMVVIFLSQFLIRMRYLAYMATASAASLLIAITAYQFEPEQFLMYTALGFAGAVLVLVVWVLYRINRNELISRVTRTTPDRFQLDAAFVQNLTVFVLPLFLVVVTQFAGRMRSVVEPVLSWLR